MGYRSQPQQSSITATKYTLYSWVIFLLPFLAGLTLTTIFYFSIRWAVVLIGLTMFVLINNILVILYKLYTRPASRLAIVFQIHIACFFGLMILGKAYAKWWLYLVLVMIFLINSFLGILHRKQLFSAGLFSRIILLITTFFPATFAFWIYFFTDWPYTIGAPGLISSISAGFCYVNGAVVETMLRNE
jgi:hypothetical protein